MSARDAAHDRHGEPLPSAFELLDADGRIDPGRWLAQLRADCPDCRAERAHRRGHRGRR